MAHGKPSMTNYIMFLLYLKSIPSYLLISHFLINKVLDVRVLDTNIQSKMHGIIRVQVITWFTHPG